MNTRPRDYPPDPRDVPLERSEIAAERYDRGNRLHAWNVPLLVVGLGCTFAFFGRGRPPIQLADSVAILFGCVVWALTLFPVVRFRSIVGGVACAAIGLLAIPLCLFSDFWSYEGQLTGLVQAFFGGACLSAMAIGGLARAGKL